MMSTPHLTNRLNKNRTALVVALCLVAFYLAYFAFLQREENEARQTYAQARSSNEAHYLQQLDTLHGFDAYFAEFAKVQHYDTPKAEVPPFLMGRWAMFDAPKQVRETYIPDNCNNALMIEDGKVKATGQNAAQYDVRYSISDGKVIASALGGEKLSIEPVAYTQHIHHLVVTLPGADQPVYAYLCK